MSTGRRTTYRLALAVAIVAAFLVIWLSLRVGIIGRGGDPANAMYFGVFAVAIAGAALLVLGRLRHRQSVSGDQERRGNGMMVLAPGT
jgi:hypothetical protein